jgi:hypothetical protein
MHTSVASNHSKKPKMTSYNKDSSDSSSESEEESVPFSTVSVLFFPSAAAAILFPAWGPVDFLASSSALDNIPYRFDQCQWAIGSL